MKKRLLFSMIGILVIVLFSACGSTEKEISKELGVDITSGTVDINSDTHGGFHGDGTRFVSIHFPDQALAEEVSKHKDWKPLPLSDNLTALVYGLTTEDGCIGPYLTEETSEGSTDTPLFPDIQKGCYYFINRQAEEDADIHDDANVPGPYSNNVTIAIYDFDTDILYYAELDT